MDTLYFYEVNIYKDPAKNKIDEFKCSIVNIACQNDDYIVIDDWYFTKIKKVKCSYDQSVNQPDIRVRTNDTIFDNGVFYQMYSTVKRRPSAIKKHIRNHLDKKFGWMNNINLSFIK